MVFPRCEGMHTRAGRRKNPIAILEAIHQGGVTVMHFVPSMLDIFVDYVQQTGNAHLMDTVKVVFASGEALHGKHVQNFHSVFGISNW